MKRFGIKEVADVSFYEILDNGNHASTPLFTLDTLKVSNIEFTAEQTEARGGKGNAPLIIWDYGREINVTLEDALMSEETFRLMYTSSAAKNLSALETNEFSIEIGANTFPGTYYIEGTTYARDETTGSDDTFKFIIPKAKVQSESTITMEADGDPTVFAINLRVLRGKDGNMITLKKEDGKVGDLGQITSATADKSAISVGDYTMVNTKLAKDGQIEWKLDDPSKASMELVNGGRAVIVKGLSVGTVNLTATGHDSTAQASIEIQ